MVFEKMKNLHRKRRLKQTKFSLLGHHEIAELLIQNGATDIDNKVFYKTSLIHAAEKGRN